VTDFPNWYQVALPVTKETLPQSFLGLMVQLASVYSHGIWLFKWCVSALADYRTLLINKKAVLPQGNRAMPQVFFSVEVRQQHSLQV